MPARLVNSAKPISWGFGWGFATGVAMVLVALLTHQAAPESPADADWATWITVNLGHSVWLFVIVLVLFTLKLRHLSQILQQTTVPAEQSKDVAALDQMLDVWIQVFIGVGVIWTAVGMRSALQAALGDPASALEDSAGNVLRKLVDGGILLALTTTIVGAVGGYLMRLGKTIFVGAALQSYYETVDRQEMVALLKAAERIEAHLDRLGPEAANVTPLSGRVS